MHDEALQFLKWAGHISIYFRIVLASIACIRECCYWHSRVATLVLAGVAARTREGCYSYSPAYYSRVRRCIKSVP